MKEDEQEKEMNHSQVEPPPRTSRLVLILTSAPPDCAADPAKLLVKIPPL